MFRKKNKLAQINEAFVKLPMSARSEGAIAAEIIAQDKSKEVSFDSAKQVLLDDLNECNNFQILPIDNYNEIVIRINLKCQIIWRFWKHPGGGVIPHRAVYVGDNQTDSTRMAMTFEQAVAIAEEYTQSMKRPD